MGIISPPSIGTNKKVKQNNSFLKNALLSSVREVVCTEDGRKMSVAQAMAERLTRIALYAESNTDAIAAQKLIFERLYGRAAVEKVDEQKEMPKVIFALKDTELEEINKSVKDASGDNDDNDDSPSILVTTDEGAMLV